jgi:outer membrane protein TolC
MESPSRRRALRHPGPPLLAILWLTCATSCLEFLRAQEPKEKVIRILPPDEKDIRVRDPEGFRPARYPMRGPPPTVSEPRWSDPGFRIGLDDAVRTSLQNSAVVRILAGTSAAPSGSTIYDPAITNTTIDQAKARFDPNLTLNNTFSKTQIPTAVFDPLDPSRAFIEGPAVNGYDMNLGLTKINSFGGTASLNVNVNPTTTTPGQGLPLNPQTTSAVTLGYTQPLLQGAGTKANLAPIIIARLNTERSFFQFKDSMQQSVRGVIQSYWSLVFARTDVWARRRQVEQGREALNRARARFDAGFADIGEVAQAETALDNFRATLIASEANELNQEAALANIIGMPPSSRFTPLTPPNAERVAVEWDPLLRLAEERRPDLIELKLIIEADQQSLYQARNAARPILNSSFQYTWNGLEGRMPNGMELSSAAGQFTSWTAGINFSVPIGLRAGRAGFRQSQLVLARDQANLEEGLQNTAHTIASDLRNLAQFYEEYKVFKEARVAARLNLDRQLENYRRGRSILLNVLQAITDWGNAVSSESQALTQYQTQLALLEQDTGTILETHGVRFWEERYRSLGPLGGLGHGQDYPKALPPTPNTVKYPTENRPAEEFFDLEDPLKTPLVPGEPLPPPRRFPRGRGGATLLPPPDSSSG